MNATDIAWVAGIIEGEGCIHLPPHSPGHVLITVQMTDEDIIKRLHGVTGVGYISGPSARGRNKPIYRWSVGQRKEVARILCAIAPLMGVRRRGRIAAAAERLARPDGRTTRPPRPIRHGTRAGYRVERYRGLDPCDACTAAMQTYSKAKYARSKEQGA